MLKGFLIEEKKHSSRVSLRHRSTNSDRQSAAGRKTTVGNEGCFPLRCHPTGSRWLSRGCGNSVMDLIQGQKAKRRARGNAQDRRPSPPSRSGPCPLPPAGGSRGPRRPGAARPTGRFSGSSRFRREGGGEGGTSPRRERVRSPGPPLSREAPGSRLQLPSGKRAPCGRLSDPPPAAGEAPHTHPGTTPGSRRRSPSSPRRVASKPGRDSGVRSAVLPRLPSPLLRPRDSPPPHGLGAGAGGVRKMAAACHFPWWSEAQVNADLV